MGDSEVVFITRMRELLANNIVYWRLERNLSQEELAYLLHSSTQYISDIENAKRNVACDFMDRLVKVLEISPSELFIPRILTKKRVRRNKN